MDSAKKTNGDFADRILREQVRLALQNLPTMQATSFIVALVLAFLVRNIIPQENIALWLLLIVAIAGSRVVLYLRFLKAREGLFAGKHWKKAILISSLLSGIIWGLAAFIVFPAGNPEFIAVFVLVIASLSAATTISHSSIRLGSLAWAGPALLLFTVRCLMEGGAFGNTTALLIIIYLVTITLYSFNHYNSITSGISLKFENLGLLEEVQKINDQLRRDIAARQQAEQSLREREENYRVLFNAITDALFVHEISDDGTPGRFLEVNQVACERLGYTREELLRMTPVDINLPGASGDVREIGRRLMAEGSLTFEYTHVARDGQPIEVEITAQLFKLGAKPAVLSLVRDITERKKLEEKIRHSQKMEAVGTLAGGVAHDLNNILSAIISYPELLLLNLAEDSPMRKPIVGIKAAGERAAAIVNDLLTLARRGIHISEVVDLNAVITDYLGSPEFEKVKSYHPKVTYEATLAPDLLHIKGSPVHLSKAVMNLLSNASEALPEGGRVFIATQNRYIDKPVKGSDQIAEGDYAVFSIHDNGVGIVKEDLEKIFEPFYTKKVLGRSGTGLGLAIVWGTVQDHQGYIDIDSEAGKGTTFTLYFPATREEIAARKKSLPIQDYSGSGERILVVDDLEVQRDIAANILRTLNYHVDTAASGEEAIEFVKSNRVDLLILDMIMTPGIDGLDTYKRILAIRPGQKAIIASGFSETDRVKEALQLGATAFIKKPYLMEKIGLTVKLALGK